MDLNNIQLFVDVMQYRSFAEVARNRNLDPSSVSRAIANLEKSLGFRLFQRTTRKLAPTEAGNSYFLQVEGLVGAFVQAGEQALDLLNQPVGTLRVSACTSFGEKILAPLLPELTQKYPKLSLDLILADHQIDIVEQRIDLAIRFGPKPKDEYVCTELAPRKFIVCASPSYSRIKEVTNDPTCLKNLDCLRFSTTGYRDSWKFRSPNTTELSIPISGNLIISHGMTMTACTVSGLGIAMIPDWLCKDEIADGRLINLFPEYECAITDFNTSAWIVYPNRDYMPLKLQLFIDFLRKKINSFEHH